MRKYLELFKNGFDDTLAERKAVENYPFVGHDALTGEVVYTDIPVYSYIYYTTVDGTIITPNTLNVGLNVAILSNEYKNGSGVIKYDGIFYEIPQEYFYLSKLTSITLPNHITELGYGSFAQCNYIESIVLPRNVVLISHSVFEHCEFLKSVVIPKSVKTIGQYAFYFCSSLTSITFEGTMEEWNNIDKGDEWHSGVLATHVQCTDGQVAL